MAFQQFKPFSPEWIGQQVDASWTVRLAHSIPGHQLAHARDPFNTSVVIQSFFNVRIEKIDLNDEGMA